MSAKSGSGVFKRAMPSIPCEASAESEAAPVSIDLSAYRRRADEMRQQLEAGADPARGLGVLALKLEEFLEDLRSVGVSNVESQPLTDLLSELRVFLGQSAPGSAALAKMTERCIEALSAFAGGRKAAARRRGWKFWK